jgi:hypothetical protein
MSNAVQFDELRDRIIQIKGQPVMLDADVAELYGVRTKRVNEAVKNNPEKFPEGYILEMERSEWDLFKSNLASPAQAGACEKDEVLRSKISTAKIAKMRFVPKAFTEKGLYMLATILKSPVAVQATLAIVETFAQIRELSRNIRELPMVADKPAQQSLLRRSGEILSGLIDDDLKVKDVETSIEVNFAVLKFSHTVKRKRS